MSEEILINILPTERRVAVLDAGQVQDFYIEYAGHSGWVGNIYCGKVTRIMPGLQAAFVEYGLEKAGFLHVSDMGEESASLRIEDQCTVGQRLFVQVIKDPMGGKGARLSTRLSLASRYVVFVHNMMSIGVSIKIEDEAERERLKGLLGPPLPEGGFIIRTAAQGASLEELQSSRDYIQSVWQKITAKMQQAQEGTLIYEEWPMALRVLRDIVNIHTRRIIIDDPHIFARAQELAHSFIPYMASKLVYYEAKEPLFESFGAEETFKNLLNPKIILPSGGYIVINYTEAMVTIDVNTGAFVGKNDLEETIYQTNKEAVEVIARQLRLRNIGGIISIDFIDMEKEEHKQSIFDSFKAALSRDPAKHSIYPISALGLLEMTRKRTRENIMQLLCEPCSACKGRGMIKTVETVCRDIIRDLFRLWRLYQSHDYRVVASVSVVELLQKKEGGFYSVIHDKGWRILWHSEPLMPPEQYDIILLPLPSVEKAEPIAPIHTVDSISS